MVSVKICGITNVADAKTAIEAGADMLGFIFYPPSPRYISFERAREIIVAGHQLSCTTRYVGVFVDESEERIRAAIMMLGLDFIQLHGREQPETVAAFSPSAFKSLQPVDRQDAELMIEKYRAALSGTCPTFIIDGRPENLPGGNGRRADWMIAREIAREFPILLAGGLNEENVADAIRLVAPWGVDVSSGVERAPGLKDSRKVNEFVGRAKGLL
ncbi:MAG TPA: phosphoribosylanthranilate isomerase [Anaerolineae bacterium]